MDQYKNVHDLAQKLKDGGLYAPDKNIVTVEDLVDELLDVGNEDKVFAQHDDHLGLKDNLSQDFLAMRLDELPHNLSDIQNDDTREQLQEVLEQANIIMPLYNRELSEDDIDDIKEDKLSRGEDIDD